MTPATRRVRVALSVEVLLGQWARQSGAPAGSAVVADAEIAARRRGGLEWAVADAVAVGVLARPEALDVASADVAFAASSLAAAHALEACRGGRRLCLWPDQLLSDPDDAVEVAVGGACDLGPGRIDLACLTVRAGPVLSPGQRAVVADALLEQLRALARRLENPRSVLDEYRDRCATLSRRLEVRLAPRGSTRGTAAGVDDRFRLVLRSPTGLEERLSVAAVESATLLAD